MDPALSETRETLLKPSPKDAGATSQPQYHSPKPWGMKTSPLGGRFHPVSEVRRRCGGFGGAEKGKEILAGA